MAYAARIWVEGVTALGPTELNQIEQALTHMPYGPDAVAGEVPVSDGANGWTMSALSSPTPATTLPGSPVNGQQTILTDSTTVPTYAWLLQYSSAASKWLFIGGSPGYASVATAEGLSGAAYAALTTAGPSFTVPRAGDYLVTVGSQQSGTALTASFHSFDIGGTGAVDANSCGQSSSGSSGTNNTNASVTNTTKITGVSASTALVSKYKSDGTHTATFTRRFISVVPTAVT